MLKFGILSWFYYFYEFTFSLKLEMEMFFDSIKCQQWSCSAVFVTNIIPLESSYLTMADAERSKASA